MSAAAVAELLAALDRLERKLDAALQPGDRQAKSDRRGRGEAGAGS